MVLANDLAVLRALGGNADAARQDLRETLASDNQCQPALLNHGLLHVDRGESTCGMVVGDAVRRLPPAARSRPPRVAILSLLFNWPSTGGGNVHTVELGQFLKRAGYEVRHVFAQFPGWNIGNVRGALSVPSEAIVVDDATWTVEEIKARFRTAIEKFDPDCVIITDSWNMKPHFAEAVRGYPYLLRFQALECLCPLNNLRLLADGPNELRQCPKNQLATPKACKECVKEFGHHSGPLHQVERALAGVGTSSYHKKLLRALDEATAVLVLNPLAREMLSPHARDVRVVPWGMNVARFPWTPADHVRDEPPNRVTRLFMAAIAGEFIKGYHVAHDACARLRASRNDFELVVTFEPAGPINEFTRSVGWLSQEELPRHYREADMCLVPTVAQEGLSRTSVEAMASGLPVIGSRIGGLPYTISDGLTGLLFEPGDSADLARKIEVLLDNPDLRRQMGLAGRRRFEEDYTWEVVIERHYRPLVDEVVSGGRANKNLLS
jgi:glycosyltransferase involved in cell wall biosynthesis